MAELRAEEEEYGFFVFPLSKHFFPCSCQPKGMASLKKKGSCQLTACSPQTPLPFNFLILLKCLLCSPILWKRNSAPEATPCFQVDFLLATLFCVVTMSLLGLSATIKHDWGHLNFLSSNPGICM